jgi:DNA modification methylase
MSNSHKHTIILGDVYDGLASLEDHLFDAAITSPPYWGQRDYDLHFQIGAENTYLEYIQKLVTVFSLLRKKLKNKGVFFLNIGDKYLSKYGNTPLGMIPYKLAHFMCVEGWLLKDIMIWYKPNHMPSSIKNRFSNTYEPVFVFSVSDENYYTLEKENQGFSNILKIKTQPTQYKHVAVYPEKLVETLLNYSIPNGGNVLDPFAGSGTTCKAAQNLSSPLNNIFFNSTMIEANPSYVEIMKKRCELHNNDIIRVPNVTRKSINLSFDISPKIQTRFSKYDYNSSQGRIKIFDNIEEYFSFVEFLKSEKGKEIIKEDGILYIGVKSNDLEIFTSTSTLNDSGWVIRNQLVIKNGNGWFPIYFIVSDTKSAEYFFNLDNIRIKHKHPINNDYHNKNFVGYKVTNASIKDRKLKGKIISIEEQHQDGFPKLVLVKWDCGTTTKEYVIHKEDTNNFLHFSCPFCQSQLKNYYSNGESICGKCKKRLWKDFSSIPTLIEKNPYTDISKQIYYYKERKEASALFEKNYNGKFKSESKINMGASPGARVSTQEEYFSVQRFYFANQPMIADYLNLLRETKCISKIDFTKLFPDSYKHTVGHWFRKDMGGSLPTSDDLDLIKKYLPIDSNYYNYINRRAIKLQTVSHDNKGKNPGDYLEIDLPSVLKLLSKTFSH